MPTTVGLPDRVGLKPSRLSLTPVPGFVLAVATSTFFLNTIHAYRTSTIRESSGVQYPASYASEERATKDPQAFLFNCAQRAHANFTENLTPFLGSLLIAGLRFPVASASIDAVWSASRIVYLVGYTSGAGPPGRRLCQDTVRNLVDENKPLLSKLGDRREEFASQG
ncbi:MAPEG family [Fusarium albosuccineum]|uniref:MAPEG family n=1 Tax=Fusarium albosuccineum TaxID=1237068 RepID=A0A8H4LN09_9HYPO|nr:MAPEG family [Fusarium albosuccineum]